MPVVQNTGGQIPLGTVVIYRSGLLGHPRIRLHPTFDHRQANSSTSQIRHLVLFPTLQVDASTLETITIKQSTKARSQKECCE